MRASKDLAKRLRFDLVPRRDLFRSRYLLLGSAAAIGGLALWLAFAGVLGPRQYLPGPVSQNHATFGDRCDACHSPFQDVKDEGCLACHGTRTHSTVEVATPPCRECHVEHRDTRSLAAVSSPSCVSCHGALATTRPEPLIQAAIATFAAHPPFTPAREGDSDQAAVRFNHRIHLTSENVNKRLKCADCHRPDARGALMRPIVFERHCRRCHELKVDGPLGAIEALHESPEAIRPDLVRKLVAEAATNGDEIFSPSDVMLPGRTGRGPIDDSRTLDAYARKWIGLLETALYKPFEEAPSLLERNKTCFLCHIEEGTRAAGELPKVATTRIPRRWLARAEFSHRPHDLLACETCHAGVRASARTTDVNLPARELCAECHADAVPQSAGTDCVLCHRYHDVSRDPALRASRRKEISLDTIRPR